MPPMLKRYALPAVVALVVCWLVLLSAVTWRDHYGTEEELAELSAPDASTEGGAAAHHGPIKGAVPLPTPGDAGLCLVSNGPGVTPTWQTCPTPNVVDGSIVVPPGMTAFTAGPAGYEVFPANTNTTALTTTVTTTSSSGSIIATGSLTIIGPPLGFGGTVLTALVSARLDIDGIPVDITQVTVQSDQQAEITVTGGIIGSLAAGSHTVSIVVGNNGNNDPSFTVNTVHGGFDGAPSGATLSGLYTNGDGGGGVFTGNVFQFVVQQNICGFGTDGGPCIGLIPITIAPPGQDASSWVGIANVDLILQGRAIGTNYWCESRLDLILWNGDAGLTMGNSIPGGSPGGAGIFPGSNPAMLGQAWSPDASLDYDGSSPCNGTIAGISLASGVFTVGVTGWTFPGFVADASTFDWTATYTVTFSE